MVKLVDFHSYIHGLVKVNPAQVQFVRAHDVGGTRLVFGAVNGGYHELQVAGPIEEAVARLEAASPRIDNDRAASADRSAEIAPPRSPRPKRQRRTSKA